MHSAGLVLKGRMTSEQWIALLRDITSAIGMTAVGTPVVFNYPLEGKGGQGTTFFLPITESFLIIDTWPDHDGAYLFVSSCREYDVGAIDEVAQKCGLEIGYALNRRFYRELDLA